VLYLCYSACRKRPRNDEDEKELINISSDDDLSKNGDEDVPVQKSQCSAATAVKADVQPSAHAKVSGNVLYIIDCQSGMGKVSQLCLQNEVFTWKIYVKNLENNGHELGKLCDALCFLLNG
jgi:hypothetical protein